MEPRIRYAKTADGVRIACYAEGEGLPLVYLLPLSGHLQLDWDLFRGNYESFPRRGYRLIRYDFRGSGLSDHAGNYSVEEFTLDLEAVLARFGVEACAIFANGPSSPFAIVFSATRPQHVSHLVLHEPFAAFDQIAGGSQVRALMALLDSDYVVFTETIASVFFGWAAGDVPRRYAALLRESQTHGEARRAAQSMASLDSRPFLSDVRAPTLICHHRGASLVPIEVLRDLSSGIPNASLVVMEGETVAGDINSPQMREAVDEFLLGAASVPSVVPPLASATVDAAATAGGTFRTILFTDVEGSTAITQRLGDEGAREVLREHERIVREALKAHGGAEVKTMGDGFMASFASATKALECAIAIQKAIQEWNQTARGEPVEPRAEEIRVRIGLNAGEPIAEADDLFGTAVNMAARIAAKAEGGEILVSDVVRQLLAGKGFVFADRGEMPLKGFEEPVRLFEVRWTT